MLGNDITGIYVATQNRGYRSLGSAVEVRGQLVRLEGEVARAPVNDLPSGHKLVLKDPQGTVQVFFPATVVPDLALLRLGQRVRVTGWCGQYDQTYEVVVRTAKDVKALRGWGSGWSCQDSQDGARDKRYSTQVLDHGRVSAWMGMRTLAAAVTRPAQRRHFVLGVRQSGIGASRHKMPCGIGLSFPSCPMQRRAAVDKPVHRYSCGQDFIDHAQTVAYCRCPQGKGLLVFVLANFEPARYISRTRRLPERQNGRTGLHEQIDNLHGPKLDSMRKRSPALGENGNPLRLQAGASLNQRLGYLEFVITGGRHQWRLLGTGRSIDGSARNQQDPGQIPGPRVPHEAIKTRLRQIRNWRTGPDRAAAPVEFARRKTSIGLQQPAQPTGFPLI